MEELITAGEVAKILKVSKATVYTLAQLGVIPCYRIGERSVRFKLSEVMEYLDRVRNDSERVPVTFK